ncbi:alpha-galactosidase, partial [bacterium]
MPDSSLPRRTFLKTGGAALLSAVIRPGIWPASAMPQEEARFVLRPDPRSGFFSIGSGSRPLIHRAFARVEFEDETCNSYDDRYKALAVKNGLLFRDARRKCDILLEALGQSFDGTILKLTVKNASGTSLKIKQIWPVLALNENGGGLTFAAAKENVRILTDEWERCYGNGGVRPLLSSQRHESAWDIHCFDAAGGRSLSLSYLDIPNAKLSFSLENRASKEELDLIIAADTRAGDRGVRVPTSGSFVLGTLLILVGQGDPTDALVKYAALIAMANHLEYRRAAPTGWVDWYFAKGNISGQDILDNVEIIARELKDFGLEYIQIDSGWQLGIETSPPPHNVVAGGPWTPNSKFPHGMKWFAEKIRAAGFKPGLWIRPFQAVKGAPERAEHPEWFNADGQMDISFPAVRDHVGEITRTVVQKWGYEYVKYDFVAYDLFKEWGPKLFGHHTAIPEPHDASLTSLQAYRKCMEAMWNETKGKARLLSCNGVMPLTLGLADAFRIGDDVGDWERTLRMGVRSIAARYYMHGHYWWNDPDCLLVREPFTLEQAQMWASLIAQTGGIVFISEDLRKLPPERLSIIKKVLPVYAPHSFPNSYARPVDFLE